MIPLIITYSSVPSNCPKSSFASSSFFTSILSVGNIVDDASDDFLSRSPSSVSSNDLKRLLTAIG